MDKNDIKGSAAELVSAYTDIPRERLRRIFLHAALLLYESNAGVSAISDLVDEYRHPMNEFAK